MKNRINWSVPRRIERSYARAIAKLIKGLLPHDADSPFSFARALRRMVRSPTYRQAALAIARSMATHVFSDGHRTWRQAASAGSKGRMLREALRDALPATYEDILSANAELIRSLPDYLADRAVKISADGAERGLRPAEVVRLLQQEMPGLADSRAKLIARTEISKASTALTAARCKAADLKWYVWRTSEDARVRTSHRHMDGVLVCWDEPPHPEVLVNEKDAGAYHAGNIYNCRCYPEVLIRYDQVRWPAKICMGGSIRRITLAKFKELAGGEL